MYNSQTIITKSNIIDIIKEQYEIINNNLIEVINTIDDAFLQEGKTHYDGFERYLGTNNVGVKMELEISIKKIHEIQKNLLSYDISKISPDVPGYILKEHIDEILILIGKGYDTLKHVHSTLGTFFIKAQNDLQNVAIYKTKYEELSKSIGDNSCNFKSLTKKYNDYRVSKKLLNKLKSGFYGFWVKNYKMSFLVILVIVLAGVSSLFTIPKESSPKIKFGIVGITTIYEGASPEDVDNLITDKIEKEIENIDGIKKITSSSLLGMSSITVEFNNDVDTAKALQDVKDKVDKVQLPTSAEDPKVIEISTNNELMFSYLLYGKKEIFSQEFIEQRARSIKDKLEGKYGIVSIDINALVGGDGTVGGGSSNSSALFKVEVLINKGKLENLGMSIGQVSSIITSFNKNQPLGSYRIGDMNYDYRIQGEFASISELEEVPLMYQNDSVIKLKDIATINRIVKNETIKSIGFYNDSGYNFVGLNFNKKEGGNIFQNAENAKKAIDELLQLEEFKGLKGVYTTDLSDMLKEDYSSLGSNGLQTLILVFVTLLFFVGLKEAVIASLFLPLSFLVTFAVLNYMGLSMNFLTNFSLILTLGIAIDTLIVVVEGAGEKMKLGYNPMSAVLLAVDEFKYSLMSGTFTTVAAFLPMMFLPGIMGKFLAYIPITIFSTLVAGLVLSLTLLSAVFYKFNKPNDYYEKDETQETYMPPESKALLNYERQGKFEGKPKNRWGITRIVGIIIMAFSIVYFYIDVFPTIWTFVVGLILIIVYIYRDEFFHWLEYTYSSSCNFILSRRINRLLLIFTPIILLIVSFATFGKVLIDKFSLFPAQDVDYFTISIEAKNGMDKDFMKKYIPQVESIVSQVPELKNYYVTLSANVINVQVDIFKKNQRKQKNMRNVFKITSELEQKLAYLESEGLKYEVSIPEGGPPGGKAVGVQLVTDSNKKFKELIEVSKEFEKHLKGVSGTKNVSNSSQETPGQFVFRFDKEKLRSLNLTPGDIMGQIYLSMNGMKSGTLKSEFDDEDIILKYEDFDKTVTPDQLQNIVINTPTGDLKLSSVLDYNFDNAVAAISREDGKITIKVEAETELGAPTLKIQEDFTKFAEQYKYPDGISFQKGGENEENADLLIATGVSFVIAIILIFTILVLQFSSYSQPLIILYSVIVALLGVNIGLYLTGNYYSMPFGIGFIALTGIVVNDAILLIETINQNLQRGLKMSIALVEAGRSRLQPIMVTTLTTCFGLLPIAMQDEFWAGLGYTVVFGLAMGSLMTVYVIPALYLENTLFKTTFKVPGFIKNIFKRKK